MSDLVIVETWLFINSRIGSATAERFWRGVRNGNCGILPVGEEDWKRTDRIARDFPDQTFSIVDRTSFALMQRLGVTRAIAFDDDFLIYRFGQGRKMVFDVVR